MHRISYDIAGLIQKCDQPADLLFALWEILSTSERNHLFSEEKTVLDAWVFDSTFGNGINDQLRNENYLEVVMGLAAIRAFEVQRLNDFSDEIERTLGKYSINCDSEESLALIEKLSDVDKKYLEMDLNKAESPFLDDIWVRGMILHAANKFIRQRLSVFQRRNGNTP